MIAPGDASLGRAQFEAVAGSTFVATSDEGAVLHLVLAAVTVAVAAAPAPAGWESFSLLFDSDTPGPLVQSTYRVDHAALGSFPLFLVPVLGPGGRAQLEAVFNRLTPEGVPT